MKISKYIGFIHALSFSTASVSYIVPSSGYTYPGIIYYSSNSFDGTVQIYFEAYLRTNNASFAAYAALYDTDGNIVAGSEISSISTVGEWVTSGEISAGLVDGKQYTVRIKIADASALAYVYTAQLKVSQSNNFTKTETQIELGGDDVTTIATSPIDVQSQFYYYYDDAQFDGTVEADFEACFFVANAAATGTVYLTDSDDNEIASVSTQSTSLIRVRSAAPFSLTTGKTYKVRYKTDNASYQVIFLSAKLIIRQSNNFTKTESFYPVFVCARATNLVAGGIAGHGLWLAADFSVDLISVYHEVALKISTATRTALADLRYNTVVLDTLSTFSTSIVRLRSAALSMTDTGAYDEKVRISATTATAYLYGVRLIIDVTLPSAPSAPSLPADPTQPSGYHCFMSQFFRNCYAALVPLKTPDGVNKCW